MNSRPVPVPLPRSPAWLWSSKLTTGRRLRISTRQIPRMIMMMMIDWINWLIDWWWRWLWWCGRTHLAVYDGLAIDVSRQKLYYADAANNSGKVGEMSTDGTNHGLLFTDVNSRPRAVVLDNDNRGLSFVIKLWSHIYIHTNVIHRLYANYLYTGVGAAGAAAPWVGQSHYFSGKR